MSFFSTRPKKAQSHPTDWRHTYWMRLMAVMFPFADLEISNGIVCFRASPPGKLVPSLTFITELTDQWLKKAQARGAPLDSPARASLLSYFQSASG